MQATETDILQVAAGEGPAYWVGPALVTCKVSSADTGGRYSCFESWDPPQSGPPLHVHHHEDEAYYILEGDYEIHRAEGPPLRATPGAYVYVPRNMVHTYKNVAATPGRMVVITTPGGLERFFAEVGVPAVDRTTPPVLSGPPDMARMAAIASKHDLEIVGPPR